MEWESLRVTANLIDDVVFAGVPLGTVGTPTLQETLPYMSLTSERYAAESAAFFQAVWLDAAGAVITGPTAGTITLEPVMLSEYRFRTAVPPFSFFSVGAAINTTGFSVQRVVIPNAARWTVRVTNMAPPGGLGITRARILALNFVP